LPRAPDTPYSIDQEINDARRHPFLGAPSLLSLGWHSLFFYLEERPYDMSAANQLAKSHTAFSPLPVRDFHFSPKRASGSL
jgi:hypothetical protein